MQLILDEVYHPLYGEAPQRSAAAYTNATILGDFSKAFSLAGPRIGWVLDRDPTRRKKLWNAPAHFTISNNMLGEILAEIATRNRETIFDRAGDVSRTNLAHLDGLFGRHPDKLEWVRPRVGMTGFPRLRHAASARPFCEAAIARGVLLSPGDCFGFPAHFRIGFGECDEGYAEAVEILSGVLTDERVTAPR